LTIDACCISSTYRAELAQKTFILPADSFHSLFEFAAYVPAASRQAQDRDRRGMPTRNVQTLEKLQTVMEFRRAAQRAQLACRTSPTANRRRQPLAIPRRLVEAAPSTH
jgi:hypothetical protein